MVPRLASTQGPRVHNSELLHLYEVIFKHGVKELDFTNFDQSSYKIILSRLRKLFWNYQN